MNARLEQHALDASIDPGEFSFVELGLVNLQMPQAFKAISQLAAKLTEAPVVIVALFDPASEREFVSTHVAVQSTTLEARHWPGSLNFCRKVVNSGSVQCDHGTAHRDTGRLYAVPEVANTAYLGAPIFDPAGRPIGTLCILDEGTRRWSAEDMATAAHLAGNASDEILLRADLFNERRTHEKLRSDHDRLSRYSGLRDAISAAFMAPNRPIEARYSDLLQASCHALGFTNAAAARLNCGRAEILACTGNGPNRKTGQTVELTDRLAGIVAQGGSMMKWSDLSTHTGPQRRGLLGDRPASYVGVPLIVSDALYGMIEFTSAAPRDEEWAEEDLSVFCLIGLLASANIELLTQAERMRDTEIQFLSILRDRRTS